MYLEQLWWYELIFVYEEWSVSLTSDLEIKEVGQNKRSPGSTPCSCSCLYFPLLMRRPWAVHKTLQSIVSTFPETCIYVAKWACKSPLSSMLLGFIFGILWSPFEFTIYFSYPFYLVLILSLLLLYIFFLSLKSGFWDRKLPEFAF